MANFLLKSLLVFLIASEYLVLDIVGQLENAPPSHSADLTSKEVQANYQLEQPHHIVKRKSKMGRGFGFGKKSKSGSNSKPKQNQNRDPYPKQPAYNPSYPGAGAPPAYPGTNSRPGYPGAPPAYPGHNSHPSYPAGPPPAYPGTGAGHHNMPAYPPAYPGHSQPGYGYGTGYGTGFGGKSYGGGGFGKSGGGGLGRTLGSAGFGAVAGTALGAYGGYKLGKMVGGLGRNGYYGYYGDDGKYIRCDPPRNIKVDPETNVTYIPLDQDYDKRCSYFDRRPPSYFGGYTNSGSSLSNNPINQLVGSIINFTIFENCHLVWDNVFALTVLAILLY